MYSFSRMRTLTRAGSPLAHAPCSRVFRRPIMASTRARTCSFLCRRLARSPARVSCRAQRAVLVLQLLHDRQQFLDALLEARELEIELLFLLVSLMDWTIGPQLSPGQS